MQKVFVRDPCNSRFSDNVRVRVNTVRNIKVKLMKINEECQFAALHLDLILRTLHQISFLFFQHWVLHHEQDSAITMYIRDYFCSFSNIMSSTYMFQ